MRRKKLEEQEGSPANNKPNNKPSRKRKQRTETQMTSALKEAKQSKKPNINRIPKRYNVPRSTSQDPHCRII